MYAQVCTRPDIAFAVGLLGRYQSNPFHDHWVDSKKVLRYLKGTRDFMLTYRRVDDLQLVGFTDSDFADCQDYRISTSGYVFMMAGRAVSWKSEKQTLIASSTMQVEFVACYGAVTQVVWFRNFMRTFTIVDFVSRLIQLYSHNSSAVLVINNNKGITWFKHIEIKYLTIKENVKNGDVNRIRYQNTRENKLCRGWHTCQQPSKPNHPTKAPSKGSRRLNTKARQQTPGKGTRDSTSCQRKRGWGLKRTPREPKLNVSLKPGEPRTCSAKL
ncbi:hypothetical protein CFOL_v3_25099 [Cephalotus follicularis]|uniref:Uncharacterized protein n=1 Tax=Cephalotus follicularis TaxID=3775 RepID=A0A1Q3CN84_CEPFO|nr:hypothetical protein CFOL_v3_25099 [Cephalotus follicularis]